MTEKRKIEAFRIGSLPFIGLWTSAQIVAWVVTLWFWEVVIDALDLPYDHILNTTSVVAPPALLAAVGHVLLVERGLKRTMRGWLPLTAVGVVLSTLVYHTIYVGNYDEGPRLALLAILVPLSIPQTIWLWRHVKTAWLWVLAAIISALIFVIPVVDGVGNNGITPYILIGLAALLQGAVMGGTMLYLQNHPLEKAKHEKAKTDQAELARLSLADQEEDFPLYANLGEQREQRQ